MKYISRALFLIAGLSIIAWLVSRAGVQTVWFQVQNLGWLFPLILLPFLAVFLFDTLGWAQAFPPGRLRKRVGTGLLFCIRLAGESINNITPTAYLGGEPVKALILKRYGIPTAEGLASAVIAKTTLALSQILFMFIGAILLVIRLRDTGVVLACLLAAIPLAGLFIYFILSWQRHGLFKPLLKIVRKLGIGVRRLEAMEGRFERVDEEIRAFHQEHPGRFAWSFLFHFSGWLAGVFEVAVILTLIGFECTWTDIFIIESLAQLAKGIGSLLPLPGSLGVQEGGGVYIFHILSLEMSTGLTLMILKRVRELVFAALGLSLASWLGVYKSEDSSESEEKSPPTFDSSI
ncbi:MAG: flippase-like domain-containing protein [Planctomycetota bacterium]|nr:flippase-like domain-containing protein [Planctomycetota bacterium]MDA1141633.1 flippase-like domain-containing protein [Planctomycetota bacterium]